MIVIEVSLLIITLDQTASNGIEISSLDPIKVDTGSHGLKRQDTIDELDRLINRFGGLENSQEL